MSFKEYLSCKVTSDPSDEGAYFCNVSDKKGIFSGTGRFALDSRPYLTEDEYQDMYKEAFEEFLNDFDDFDLVSDLEEEYRDEHAELFEDDEDYDELDDEDERNVAMHDWVNSVLEERKKEIAEDEFEMDPDIKEQRNWSIELGIDFKIDEDGCLSSIRRYAEAHCFGDSGLGGDDPDDFWTGEDTDDMDSSWYEGGITACLSDGVFRWHRKPTLIYLSNKR